MSQKKKDTLFDIGPAAEPPKGAQRFSLDKAMDNLVGTFCDPIIVHQCAWATNDIIPDWLRKRITMDRLIEQMVANKEGRDPEGTDSEALAYMIPASLEFPLDHDWAQIYLYLATRVMDGEGNKVVPDDIRVDKLDRNQEDDLRRLKAWIHRTKANHRTEKTRDIRKAEEKEMKAAKEAKEAAAGTQMSYFDF